MPINLSKQFTFSLATALTKTAKTAQREVVGAIRDNFAIRNNWVEPGNAMGIRVLPATKDDLSVAVVTRASWLNPFEDGRGIKVPFGGHMYLAMPTKYVRRNKRDIIRTDQRPKNLQDTFVKTGKSGRLIIYQRQGKGRNRRIVPMYILLPEVHIPHTSAVVDTTVKVFVRDFSDEFFKQLQNAIRTAK